MYKLLLFTIFVTFFLHNDGIAANPFENWVEVLEQNYQFGSPKALKPRRFVKFMNAPVKYPIADVTQFQMDTSHWKESFDAKEFSDLFLVMFGQKKWNLKRKYKKSHIYVLEVDKLNRLFVFWVTPISKNRANISFSSMRRGGYIRYNFVESIALQYSLSVDPNLKKTVNNDLRTIINLFNPFAQAHAQGGLPIPGGGGVPGGGGGVGSLGATAASMAVSANVLATAAADGAGAAADARAVTSGVRETYEDHEEGIDQALTDAEDTMTNVKELSDNVSDAWDDAEAWVTGAGETLNDTISAITSDPIKYGAYAAGAIVGVSALQGFGQALGDAAASMLFYGIPKLIISGIGELYNVVSGKYRRMKARDYEDMLDKFAEMRSELILAEEEMENFINDFLKVNLDRMVDLVALNQRMKNLKFMFPRCHDLVEPQIMAIEELLPKLEDAYFKACHKAEARIAELMSLEVKMVEIAKKIDDDYFFYTSQVHREKRSADSDARDDGDREYQDYESKRAMVKIVKRIREDCVAKLDDIDPRLGTIYEGCFKKRYVKDNLKKLQANHDPCLNEVRQFTGIPPVENGMSTDKPPVDKVESIDTLRKYRGSRIFTNFKRQGRKALERHSESYLGRKQISFSSSDRISVKESVSYCGRQIEAEVESMQHSLEANTEESLLAESEAVEETKRKLARSQRDFGNKMRKCFGDKEKCDPRSGEEKLFNYNYYENILFGYTEERDDAHDWYDDDINGLCSPEYWDSRKRSIIEGENVKALSGSHNPTSAETGSMKSEGAELLEGGARQRQYEGPGN
ncbi:MAG: hypothetical protein HOE90_24360 [Bacteriovoracaceae bacterium]|jgi:hypothetical protein|nr:hypothetical protein [Bacteriovoracaceae bacterium]